MLGIELPIVQAPMAGGWTTPELVAAVSNAGGLGMLPAARRTVDQLAGDIEAVSRLTTKPFGVNFLIAPPEPFDGNDDAVQAFLDPIRARFGLPAGTGRVRLPPPAIDEQIELVGARRIPVVSFAMGNPHRFLDRLRAAKALAFGTATTADEAVALEQAGVHAVVTQGAEAGGHRATFDVSAPEELPLIGTMVLVPQVVDRVSVPVIAAGGIADGRGMAAALALGASGVQMGTRFLTVEESGAFPDYRARILRSDGTDTTVTRRVSGRPARALRTRLLREMHDRGVESLPWPYQGVAAQDVYAAAIGAGAGDFAPMLAGQGGAMARPGQRAQEVVAEVAADAVRVLLALSRGEDRQ
jgi:nitronate monooxygenase